MAGISTVLAYSLYAATFFPACSNDSNLNHRTAGAYLDNSGRDDAQSGGVKLIPVHTPNGDFRVWTKRVGNNPTIKVLLLHGGPGMTHEYFEAFDSYFPAAGIEYYFYDQLGSACSDQPDAPELWEVPRFVEEVEQVRQALGLDQSNFYLLGQSWGGILAIEYALKYQQHLKGLVISNMMVSARMQLTALRSAADAPSARRPEESVPVLNGRQRKGSRNEGFCARHRGSRRQE